MERKMSRSFASSDGVVFLETAMVLPLFFTFLLVGMDLLRVSYNALTAQFVIERAMRQIVVHQVTKPQVQTLVTAIAGDFGLTIDTNKIQLCPISNGTSSPNCNDVVPGASGALMALTVDIEPHGILLGRMGTSILTSIFKIRSMVVARNEFFDNPS